MNVAPRALVLAAAVSHRGSRARRDLPLDRWRGPPALHGEPRPGPAGPARGGPARRRGARRGPRARAPLLGVSSPPASRAPRAARGEIEIRFARMGSLMRVDATVNDLVRVPFLVDTGASGVSIPSAYVEKLGFRIRPTRRTYRSPPRTASWRGR